MGSYTLFEIYLKPSVEINDKTQILEDIIGPINEKGKVILGRDLTIRPDKSYYEMVMKQVTSHGINIATNIAEST